MTRTVAVVLAVLIGIVAQLWLAYHAAFWAWVSATPNANLAVVRRNFYLCSVPCFAIFIGQLGAIWFLIALPRIRRRRRRSKGECVRCGYDLTGNTSGVCPECGVEVQA